MHLSGAELSLSATDLSNFLGCRHRTALEMNVAAHLIARPQFHDPILELLSKRGLEHESSHLAFLSVDGKTVADLSKLPKDSDFAAATVAVMRSGADVVYQGVFRDDQWNGKPDFLIRVEKRSALGDWSYEVVDTKLARDTRAGTILQLGLYSAMLGVLQGKDPECFHVVMPGTEHANHSFRVDDYAAYVRLVRNDLAAIVKHSSAEIAAEYYPEPVEHCSICPWSSTCSQRRRSDDHLSLVANIRRAQRGELGEQGVSTLGELARFPLPISFKPKYGAASSYERVREQARLQLESRDKSPPLHELRALEKERGLARLPEPSPGDIFLDLEGDNIAFEGGREYLFGLVTIAENGEPVYQRHWGFNDADERTSFQRVIDLIVKNSTAYPGMHVYHYAPYEVTAFKRLAGHYTTRENELDSMLRADRFVDLFAVVRQSMLAGIERYSIKNLEPLYGYVREVELGDARRELGHLVYALAVGKEDALPSEVRDTVQGYNRDDCISTLRLRDWLETVRRSAIAEGADIPRPMLAPSEPSEALNEKQEKTEVLRRQLLDGIDGNPQAGTPEHGRWLLAYMLDFHRREDKAGWWKYFDLVKSDDDKLTDEPDAIAGLERTGHQELVKRKNSDKPTGSVIERYSYPPQEMEIRRGDELHTLEKTKFGKVEDLDRDAHWIAVRKGKAQVDTHPTAVFKHSHIDKGVIEEAIASVALAVLTAPLCNNANGVARTLLLREPPSLLTGAFSQPMDPSVDLCALAVDTVARLDHSVLAIQGPPGTGKTFTGARMIRSLVAAGKRVGVLANSHKVITNLMIALEEDAAKANVTVRIAQKAPNTEADPLPAFITSTDDNEEAARLLAEREVDVMGGTVFFWSRPEMIDSVDYLFVDEAGQLALANAVAVSGAATNMVLLGDPQQLDQPLQGSHKDELKRSVLQHMLGDHKTIPSDRGIFLSTTWRLSPAICAFTSEMFYEKRLDSRAGLEKQMLSGISGLEGSGLWYVDVKHDGCTSSSSEEVAVVADLVARLSAPGSMWTADSGVTSQITIDDILVVSPFNAQVSRLRDRLPKGCRVGTVDKFQGQAAPVVIYSMCTSSPEDAPRGMEFLYSLNRLNVATSRAKCAAIVAANPRLFAPECKSPQQMKLANALCRYKEMAQAIGE